MDFKFESKSIQRLLEVAATDICEIEYCSEKFQIHYYAAIAFSGKIHTISKTDPSTRKFSIEGDLIDKTHISFAQEFFSKGTISSSFGIDEITDIYKFAKSFDFEDLLSYVPNYLNQIPTYLVKQNLSSIFKIFTNIGVQSTQALNYVLQNFYWMPFKDLLSIFPSIDNDSIIHIFTAYNLAVKNENQVAYLLLKLAEQDIKYSKYFELINLEWMTPKYITMLNNFARENKLYNSQSYFYRLLEQIADQQKQIIMFNPLYPRKWGHIQKKIYHIGSYQKTASLFNIFVFSFKCPTHNAEFKSNLPEYNNTNYAYPEFYIQNPYSSAYSCELSYVDSEIEVLDQSDQSTPKS